MKSVLVSFVVAAALLCSGPAAHAGSVAYFTDFADDFGTIDLDTGSYHVSGVLPNNLGGIGYGPNGVLYGLDWTDTLVRINPGTAAVSTVGPSGLTPPPGNPPDSSSIPFTALSNGRLYGVDTSNVLYTFNPLTGQATVIGSTGIPAAGAGQTWSNSLAGVNGNLFYTYQLFDANTGSPLDEAQVYRIDPATGAATLLGPVDVSADLPFFGAGSVAGVLYGFTVDINTLVREIYTIDEQTGKASFVTDVAPGLPGILSATAVPEPSHLFLAGLGLVFLRGVRRAVAEGL